MEDFDSNTTEENSFNNSKGDGTDNYVYNTHYSNILNLLNWTSIGIGLLLILIVMIAVFSQVRKGQDAPIYVINLLVSDLIQLCSRIPVDFTRLSDTDFTYISSIFFGIMVSVGFMVCICWERYLVIAKPLWYRFRRKNKTYVVVCTVVWILPLFYPVLGDGIKQYNIAIIFFIAILFLPFPLFIFFLVGTIKALSGVLGVPADEKRRITAIQVVVLIIYTLLYLPVIFLLLGAYGVLDNKISIVLHNMAFVCVFLSPLADTTLYLFTRKTILDKFLASICSCKISNNQQTSSTDYESRTVTNTETV